MLQDLDTSKAEMEKYKRLNHRGRPNNIEMDVRILGACSWDIEKTKLEKIAYPKSIGVCIEDFKSFYTRDRSMYKLDFAFGLVI